MSDDLTAKKFEQLQQVADMLDDLSTKHDSGFGDILLEKRPQEMHELPARHAKFKAAFGVKPPAPDPLNTPFAKDMLLQIKNRWAHDRSAAKDQITGTAYSKIRTAELAEVSGNNYLARQYGIRTAKNRLDPKSQSGLRTDNPNSSTYNRDIPSDELRGYCQKIYTKKGYQLPQGGGDPAKSRLQFANSEAAVERYKFFYGADKITDVRSDLGHGVVAIELSESDENIQKRLRELGATPSVSEVMKRADDNDGAVPLSAESLKNGEKLGRISGANNPAIVSLNQLPNDHAMKEVTRSAVSMVRGLEKALAVQKNADSFEKNPLIDNSLKALETAVAALPTLTGDSERFFRAYEAMMDEIYIVLAAAKPYGKDACKNAGSAVLKRHAPVLKDFDTSVKMETCLVSSGMDAITTGWQTASILAGSKQAKSLAGRGEKNPDYFEVGLVMEDSKLGGADDIVTATLNPSRPQGTGVKDDPNAWNADILINEVEKKLEAKKPLVLLLDVTVEKESDNEGKSELNRVMAAFKTPIEAGDLKVVLAKSYQKYPSLGSGKVMAGSVTILAKGGDGTETDSVASATKSLTEAEASLDWMQNDDSQLLAHFLTEGSDSEVPMLKRAAKNASFAQKMCSGGGWLNYEPGLPFALVKQDIPELPCRKRASNLDERAGIQITMGTLINRCGADYKDSFAFLGTSYLTDVPTDSGNACRVTLGQDSEAEVVEKLWSIGHVAAKAKDGGEIGPKTITTAAAKVADSACKEVSDKAKLSAWAEKAIEIAKRNGVDVKALQADWAKCRQQLENPEKPSEGVKSPEEMRTALKQVLEASHARSKNKLGDQLEITSSAFPMRVPDKTRKGDSVGAMIASAAPTWQGEGDAEPSDETRFAPNIVASCLNLMGAAYGPEDADAGDLATIEQLYEAAIGAGLQGVSARTQTKIIAGWTRLQKGKLLNPATRKRTLGKVAETAKMLPHPEDRAKVLSDSISDEVFESAEPDDRDQIAQDLTGGLDFDLRMIFVSKLATTKQFAKARACIAAFRKQAKEAVKGGGEVVRPDRLSGSPDNPSGAPVALSAEEVEKRLRQLQSLETAVLLNQIDALKSAIPKVTLQTQKDFSLRVMELGRGVREQTAKAKEMIAPAMDELVKMLQQHSQSLVGRG